MTTTTPLGVFNGIDPRDAGLYTVQQDLDIINEKFGAANPNKSVEHINMVFEMKGFNLTN